MKDVSFSEQEGQSNQWLWGRKQAEDIGENFADLGDSVGHIYAWNAMPLILLALLYFRDSDH